MRRLLILILTLWTFYGFGQRASLKGELTDRRNGRVLSNAVIELWKIDTTTGTIHFLDTLYSLVATTTTDNSGKFLFRKIATGNYTLFYKTNLDSIGNYFDKSHVMLVNGKTTNAILKLPYYCSLRMDYNSNICPYCHKADLTIPIIFGLPDEITMAQAEKGEIWLGGCISDKYCQPKRYCKRDDRVF